MLLIKHTETAFLPLIFPNTDYGKPTNSLLNTGEFPTCDDMRIADSSKEFSEISDFEHSDSFSSNIEVPDLELIEKQASEIIEKAKKEAETILGQANKQAKEIERIAKEQGLAQARIETNLELNKAVDTINKDMSKSLEELAFLQQQIASHMEQEMLKLSIEIAKKVVHRELTTDREVILSLVRVALARLHNRTVASVRLNPTDYQYVIANSERISGGKTIELAPDPTITRGGCIIETDFGSIDARIEQQFAEIERSLL